MKDAAASGVGVCIRKRAWTMDSRMGVCWTGQKSQSRVILGRATLTKAIYSWPAGWRGKQCAIKSHDYKSAEFDEAPSCVVGAGSLGKVACIA